jgi:hypothetical protein
MYSDSQTGEKRELQKRQISTGPTTYLQMIGVSVISDLAFRQICDSLGWPDKICKELQTIVFLSGC